MKKLVILLAVLIAFLGLAVNVYGQQPKPDPNVPKILQLDGMIKEFSILEAKNAQYGIEKRPPGGGGPAFYMSNAKVPNDIRIEAQFVLKDFIDASPYNYLVFEMMGDTWEVMNDINEHYPRFRVDDVFVQFQGSFIFRGQIDRVLDGASKKWITIGIPIALFNTHENKQNFSVMSNVNIFLLRFIANRAPIKGKIYFRNIRLQQEPPPQL